MNHSGFMRAATTAIGLSLTLASFPDGHADKAPPSGAVSVDFCSSIAKAIYGNIPLQPIDAGSQPKLIHKVNPDLSSRLHPRGSGSWMGQALITPEGKVKQVWTIREPEFEPPWPEFSSAVSDAILSWRYEPTKIRGKPVPVCVTIVVEIDFR